MAAHAFGSDSLASPASTVPWCSVIIPTLNEAKALPITLASLAAAQLAGQIEIIVSDGGSSDATVAIAQAHGCITVHGTRGRGRQMNAGAERARASHLWFLHADTTPPADWPDHLARARARNAPACFSIRFDTQARSSWLRLFSRMSSWDVPAFRFGDQSLFIQRSLFNHIGGFREDMQLLEDNDIVVRARSAAGSFVLLNGQVTTSARRYHHYGVLKTQAYYVVLYALYKLGCSQSGLVKIYEWAFPNGSK